MKSYNTAGLDKRELARLNPNEASWVYNGLDCCVTFEIHEKLTEELETEPPEVSRTYQDSLDKLAPVLYMQMRGFKVSIPARDEAVRILTSRLNALNTRFQRIMQGAFDVEHLNWNSPVQVKMLFYSILGLREIKKRNAKGQYVATVDENALKQLCSNFYAEPLANYILAMREVTKKIELLTTGIDPDNRFRTSLNIAGTNTGRLSSSESAFGTGRNLQNVDTTLRFPFIADNGKILVNVDLEQSDARNVGARIWELFVADYGVEEAGLYLDACESGDLHTAVTKMVWPELGWGETIDESGQLIPDREIADQLFYRSMSYRDCSKRLGHGTNFMGTPRTMAKHTHTETSIIEVFQQRYFERFILIPEWHKWVISTIKQEGCLTTLYGRRRFFYGRADDATTHRKAVAYEPQSMTGHAIDMGYLNLWRHMPEADLLIQVHDSITFQVPYRQHEELIPQALELLQHSITLREGRRFAVPLDAKVGWNWGNQIWKKGKLTGNEHGLRSWKGEPVAELPPPTLRIKDYL